jgi:hypothetical protein
MLPAKGHALGAASLLCLCLTSCATTHSWMETTATNDRLPASASRGYVEFYLERPVELEHPASVYQTVGGEDAKVGEFGRWNGRLRIATEPGDQSFTVQLGNLRQHLRLKVLEGMSVPVKTTVTETGSKAIGEYHFPIYMDHYLVELRIEEAVPLAPLPSR